MATVKPLTGRDFEALPDAEKERIYQQLDRITDEELAKARPLTRAERRRHFQPPKRAGRPRLGNAGTAVISASIEKGLLDAVNAYAKAKGIKRSALISAALRSVIGKSA